MSQYRLAFLSVIIIVLALACSQEKQNECTPAPLNPNGDSELALLMRQMAVESDSIRIAVLSGKEHPVWDKLKALHTAQPTDSTVSGPVFDGFASAFINATKTFEESDSLKLKHFNAVVDGCMQCHQEFCPGPMKRIAKLYIPE